MIELRPYQIDAVDRAMQALAAGERPIIVSPTGSGKTVIICEIIKRLVAAHKRILVLAHRREIIHQTKQKLEMHGVRCSIIMANSEYELRLYESVQVAAIATLWVRAIRSDRIKLPLADLIIIDEAHHAVAHTYRKIIEAYPGAMVLGATATPCRGDDKGLGGIFTTLIEAPQILELIEQGHLVRSRVYAPIDPDLRGVATRNGDYVESQLADRMDRDRLVGDIVTHWHKYGERRRTVAFACSVAHSIHIKDEFIRSGVRAEHIDGSTPKPERDASLARLASGEIDIVCNCMVLTEGWDMPEVGCCILARPTKRMGLFRQMIGRVLRPANGKPDAIVLDHSGAVFKHGLPEDRVVWTLDGERKVEAPAHQARLEHRAAGLIECTQCSALRLGGKPCPACGFMPKRPAEYVRIQDGDLGLVTSGRAAPTYYDPETRAQWHGMLIYIANERSYKRGWAAVNYKEKFGAWPPYGSTPEPIIPTPEVRSWVRSRLIAYAKRSSAPAA
jgi:superfamily II DNA or RNA helicase